MSGGRVEPFCGGRTVDAMAPPGAVDVITLTAAAVIALDVKYI